MQKRFLIYLDYCHLGDKNPFTDCAKKITIVKTKVAKQTETLIEGQG